MKMPSYCSSNLTKSFFFEKKATKLYPVFCPMFQIAWASAPPPQSGAEYPIGVEASAPYPYGVKAEAEGFIQSKGEKAI
jgi:hypothetical protein